MSDFEATGDPNHKCGEDCKMYVPLAFQNLEDLEESEHIDALYKILNLAREHAAWLVLNLARASSPVQITPRTAALALDLDEDELLDELGQTFTAMTLVDHAIKSQGEDGYVGKAIEAAFRIELYNG
ncbi:hypothetical protein ACFY1Q_11860 [Streptomyces albidoflavus]